MIMTRSTLNRPSIVFLMIFSFCGFYPAIFADAGDELSNIDSVADHGAAAQIKLDEVESSNYAFGLGVGTLGVGAAFTINQSEQWKTRIQLNQLEKSYSYSNSDLRFDAKGKLSSVAGLFDYHPFAGNLKLTFGALLNNNKIAMNVLPGVTTSSYTFNGVNYSIDSASIDVKFNQFAPYLGFGFGNGFDNNDTLNFNLDFGVMFQGSPKLNFDVVGSSSIVNNPTFISNKAAEQNKINDNLKKFQYYPVLQFTVNYVF